MYDNSYTPNRAIVDKIQQYDPLLFVRWNNKEKWFEIWRKYKAKEIYKINGDTYTFSVEKPKMITTVTDSIYDGESVRSFCELDERILWWLYEADSWKGDQAKKHLEGDKRWQEFQANIHKKNRSMFRDLAKDTWCAANNFYTNNRKVTKKSLPKFENYKKKQEWVRPDSQSRAYGRTMARTSGNAKKYNYQANK